MRILFQIIVLLCFPLTFVGQASMGQWTDYFSFDEGKAVVKAGNKIYCVSNASLFYVDLDDNSVHKFSKFHGLSDVEPSAVGYHDAANTLIVGYATGNIDLVIGDEIYNIPDVKMSNIQASKVVNHVFIKGDFAYLSMGFGIIVLDVVKKEIKDTYYPGENGSLENINELIVFNDTIFAASNNGVYLGPLSLNLNSYLTWKKDAKINKGVINTLTNFNGKVLVNIHDKSKANADTLYTYSKGVWQKLIPENYSNNACYRLTYLDNKLLTCHNFYLKVYGNDAKELQHLYVYNTNIGIEPKDVIFANGLYWIADYRQALASISSNFGGKIYKPSGPRVGRAFDVEYADGKIWMAHGSWFYTMHGYTFDKHGVAKYENGNWYNFYGGGFDTLDAIHKVAINPSNSEHIFAASYGNGLVEVKNGKIVNVFNEGNSVLYPSPEWRRVLTSGVTFDKNGVVWISVSSFQNSKIQYPLAAYYGGKFYGFDINKYITTGSWVRDIIVDKNTGYVWLLSFQNGIIVYDANGTLDNKTDDRSRLITNGTSNGNLPSDFVNSIAQDEDGKIWIGSDEGVFVINDPSKVFDETPKVEKIIIKQGENVGYLLESEQIISIKVDGANRKWFGTETGGLYLFDATGTEQIHHFNTSNSPLITNTIYDIEINGNTGEVLLSTDRGLIAYMGDATDADQYTGPIYSYPNPVPPDYEGNIGIRGLPKNAQVKIADIAGNVLFEGKAEGGSISWNGKSLSGQRPKSGVYIVFAVTNDGEEKAITKILFIN